MKTFNGLETRALGFQVGYAIAFEREWAEREQYRNTRLKEREELAQKIHVADENVLDELLDSGFGADSVAALPLFPLVVIAWCDCRIGEGEKAEILAEAKRLGITADSPAFAILTQWLKKFPGKQLEHLWQHFMEAYLKTLSPFMRCSLLEHLQIEMKKVAIASHHLHIPVLTKTERETINRLSTCLSDAA